MRKINLLLFSVLLSFGLIRAQVGINTKTPQGKFHIDGKGDTSGSTNAGDDVVVKSDGKVGLGTVAPQAKLHINGAIRIVDGTQGIDKFLVADNNGLAKWLPANILDYKEGRLLGKIGDAADGSATLLNGTLAKPADITLDKMVLKSGRWLIYASFVIIQSPGGIALTEDMREGTFIQIHNVTLGNVIVDKTCEMGEIAAGRNGHPRIFTFVEIPEGQVYTFSVSAYQAATATACVFYAHEGSSFWAVKVG